MRLKIYPLLIICVALLGCKHEDDSTKAIELNNLGLQLTNQGKDREAIYVYQQAASYRNIPTTDRTTFLSNLALAYHKINMNDSAKYFYKKAANMNKRGSYNYLVNVAYVYLIDKRLDTTCKLLEKAYKADSTMVSVNNLLGVIWLGEYDKNYYDPVKALRYNANAYKMLQDGDTKFMLAKNYYQVENTAESLRLFRELHYEYPDYIAYLVTLIMIEQEMNNLSEAEKLLEELKTKDPEKYKQRRADPIEPGTHVIVWNPD